MTQKDLANKTLLPGRTVRLALTHLLKKGYVKKKVSIRDARQKIYEISKIKWMLYYFSDAALINAKKDSSGYPGLLLNSGWNCTPR